MRRSGREVPKVKRVLELNASHPLLARLQAFHATHPADERFRRYAEVLHGQAILAEGGTLPDPAGFSRRLAELLVEATGED
jgi:molecular chaperone HtpG